MTEQTLTDTSTSDTSSSDIESSDETLDVELSEQVRGLCQQGYTLFDQQDYTGAIRQFFSAWTLLPKPQTQWREAGWVLTALGDAYFAKGNYDSGIEALRSALHCPMTRDNPIVHLRLGQCLFELGELQEGQKHLAFALQQAGAQLFEKEDAKYLAALESN